MSPWEMEQQICGYLLDIRSHIVFQLRVPLGATQAKLLESMGGHSKAKIETCFLSGGSYGL